MEKTSKKGLILVALLLIALFTVYLKRDAIYAEMKALNLVPTPQRFTELYFENSASLPSETVAGKPLTFSFIVHNEEGTSTLYPYAVYFENSDGSQVTLASGNLALGDGDSTTTAISYIPTASDLRGKVIVDLTQLNQEIDFLLPNNNT